MTTEEKYKLMKNRERIFTDMAKHYEGLAWKCWLAMVELDKQIDKEVSDKWEKQRAMRGIEKAFQALSQN